MKPFNEHNEQTWDFKNVSQQLHGDVIVERIDKMPKEFKDAMKVKDDCLAHGEVTGHMHKLFRFGEDVGATPAFDLRMDHDGIKWLKVEAPTVVKHQEHSPRVIQPGVYRIGIQREYDPFTKRARSVAD